MASTSAVGTTQNNPNYLGMLFKVGQDETPFLNMLGGINGARPVSSAEFALNSNYALNAASQNTVSEDDSTSAGTPNTYARSQDTNAIQVMKYSIDVSFKNESDISTLAGVPAWAGPNYVTDKRAEQIAANMEQMAIDLDYSCVNGTYVTAATSAINAKTRGIIEACTTNAIDASAAALSKTLVNNLTKTMVDNGARLKNGKCVIHVNSSKKQELTDIFGLQDRSGVVGGVNVEMLKTDFGDLPVIYNPSIPQNTVLIADMSICSLAVLPVRGQAVLLQKTAQVGASEPYMLYGQFGLDYGIEFRHGVITNLA